MPSRFAAVTNKEIIKQAVAEIHKEGDQVRFGSLGNAFSFWLDELIDETGEKVFCWQMQIKLLCYFI